MKYTHPVFRPPFEAHSLLLQVTVGCSHNSCAFCSMYSDVRFQAETIEQIERDLREARRNCIEVKRVFLVSGDPFCLSSARLAEIADKINVILPEVETIAMYASIQNIGAKTDDELKALRARKINDLNIGLESGLSEVVHDLNKGFTIDEAKHQLQRLQAAGFDFSLNIIIGAGGRQKYRENAIASAEIINEIQPHLIFIATLHLEEDCVLAAKLEQGLFAENTLRENLEEEILFLKHLQLKNTRFFGLHPSNTIRLDGQLPVDKERMLKELEHGLASIDAKYLDVQNTRLVRGNEGAVLLRD
ncbi:radical SAM protein [Desulfopila aestuarii]|uniref:Radical SAM superfamily protein n=1 Tax=Desulfopila aestuarii DSM 18488 TaxID=1121416 RepID=A0A1M7XYA0_9BACT|nr:radical SAM protein [Desulfopila aestuarii]SHO43979.1 Radical SAM superfamily protein [Desulfopila aestuarii DSM 18488]